MLSCDTLNICPSIDVHFVNYNTIVLRYHFVSFIIFINDNKNNIIRFYFESNL